MLRILSSVTGFPGAQGDMLGSQVKMKNEDIKKVIN